MPYDQDKRSNVSWHLHDGFGFVVSSTKAEIETFEKHKLEGADGHLRFLAHRKINSTTHGPAFLTFHNYMVY